MNSENNRNHTRYLALGLFLFALVLRLYRIKAPLWVDEFYSLALAQQGLSAIFKNGFADPHPPLYYVILWLITGSGSIHSEIALRWFSVLCGALTVLFIWKSTRLLDGVFSAALMALVAATSPVLMFYSQEARSYALLILVSSVSVYLMIKIIDLKTIGTRTYAWWTILSLIGIYTSYSYLMLAALQIFVIGYLGKFQRSWKISTLVFMIGAVLLIPYAVTSMGILESNYAAAEPLTFWRTLQTITAGEQVRYGVSSAHTVLPVLLLLLIAAGLTRMNNKGNLYLLAQTAYPFLAVFALLTPVLGIRLPLDGARQFLVLLPLLYALASTGLGSFRKVLYANRFLRIIVPVGLTIGLLLMNARELKDYWHKSKSAGSELVIKVLERAKAGEDFVSLHYSTEAALGYYSRSGKIYFQPHFEEDQYQYIGVESPDYIFYKERPPEESFHTTDIRKKGHFWVFYHTAVENMSLDSLIVNCDIVDTVTVKPYEAVRIETCD